MNGRDWFEPVLVNGAFGTVERGPSPTQRDGCSSMHTTVQLGRLGLARTLRPIR